VSSTVAAGRQPQQRDLVSSLPAEFPAAIAVVLHLAASGTSVLPQILSRRGVLPASFGTDNEELRRGQIYVAPPDHHLLVHESHVRLSRGPRENGHRPAIDPLFRSAARDAGPRVIGVVLSGLLDDGASGLRFIREHGGAAIVQDPADAMFPGMPRAAIAAAEPNRVVPLDAMADALSEMIEARRDPIHAAPAPEHDRGEPDLVELEPAVTAALVDGPPTALSCPECGGALWEQGEGKATRYACHVGHAYSLDSLVEEQGRALEVNLWSALRALQERADMQRRLARRMRGPERARCHREAREAERHAARLREALEAIGRSVAPPPEVEVG
jgi:two-component system chemotaxis response regulator CheB